MPDILKLVQELAHFEKCSERVQATDASLASTIRFAPSRSNPNPKPAVAYCLLATLPPEHGTRQSTAGSALSSNPAFNPPALTETKGAASTSSAATDADRIARASIAQDETAERVAGFALYFHSYSTWLAAPGVYLEDLYIRPEYRRRGYATLLFGRLGQEVQSVCGDTGGRLDWSCLRWNENALKFYESIGGKRMEEWVGIRVEGKDAIGRLAAMAEGKIA